MNRKPNDCAAFPLDGSAKRNTEVGMSLRDYLAGQAIQGFCSSYNLDWVKNATAGIRAGSAGYISTAAYEIADAMLAERAK